MKTYLAFVLATAVAVSVLCPVAVAAPHDLLQFVPADAPGALVAPSLTVLQAQYDRLFAQAAPAFPKTLDGWAAQGASEMGLAGVNTLSGLADELGVAMDQPVAVIGVADGFVLPVASQDKAIAVLKARIPMLEEVQIAGATAYCESGGGFGGFFNDGYFIAALSRDALEGLAKSATNPAPALYGASSFPAVSAEEVFALLRPALLKGVPALAGMDELQTLLSVLGPVFDEAVLALQVGDTLANVRLAGHVTGDPIAQPGPPLSMQNIFPDGTVALTVLRTTAELKGFVSEALKAALADDPTTMQRVSGMFNGIAGNLGEELALGMVKPEAGSAGPALVADVLATAPLLMLMRMAGLGREPVFTEGDAPVFVAEGLLDGQDLYVADLNNRLIATVSEPGMKAMLAKQAAEAPAPPAFVTGDAVRRGNYGFLAVKGGEGAAALRELARGGVPGLGALSDATLTLEDHGTWRQMAVEMPASSVLDLLPAGVL